MIKRLCLSFQEALDALCLPMCAAHGVIVSCETCMPPWTEKDRRWFWRKLVAFQSQLEKHLGSPICPKQICDEIHTLECPIKLDHSPIAYVGVKVQVKIGTYPICYTKRSACLPNEVNAPQGVTQRCDDADEYIGYVDIPTADLPDGVGASDLFFVYGDDCRRKAVIPLEQPSFDCPHCGGTDEGEHVQAVWSKCHLKNPIYDRPVAINSQYGFLTHVDVYYEYVDESQAVVPIGECDCGCGQCSRSDGGCGFEIEIGDAFTGVICIKPTGRCCGSCAKRVRINYGTAADGCASEMAPELREILPLGALLKMGAKQICDCSEYASTIKYWLKDSSDAARPMVTPGMLPFGGTNAGMEISRVLGDFRKGENMKQGGVGGSFTGHGLRALNKTNRRARW